LGLGPRAVGGHGDAAGHHGQQGHAGQHDPAVAAGSGSGGYSLGFDHVSSSSGVAPFDGRKPDPVPTVRENPATNRANPGFGGAIRPTESAQSRRWAPSGQAATEGVPAALPN